MARLQRLLWIAVSTSVVVILKTISNMRETPGTLENRTEYHTHVYTQPQNVSKSPYVKYEYMNNEKYKGIVRKHVPLSKDIQHVYLEDALRSSNSSVRNQYVKLNLTSQLKERIALALSRYPCHRHTSTNGTLQPVKFICRHHSNTPALVTLFTTMYDNKDKVMTFNTTLNVWAGLGNALKPILFVTPNVNRLEENLFYLIEQACLLKWDVAISPSCNKDNFPIVPSMFLAAYSMYESEWYGFANGDILVDETMLDALLFLRQYSNSMNRYTMLLGRRHDIQVQTIIKIGKLQSELTKSSLHKDYGADYFLTPRDGFPWHETPPVVAGRPLYDNYVMWLSRNREDVTDIDGTDAILALHLGRDGWRQHKNPWTIAYNPRVIKEAEKNSTQKFTKTYGRTECLNFMIGNIKNPYKQLYKRKLKLRGRDQGVHCSSTCCSYGYTIVKKNTT